MTLCYRCGWTGPKSFLGRYLLYGRRVLLCGTCTDWIADRLAEEAEEEDDNAA